MQILCCQSGAMIYGYIMRIKFAFISPEENMPPQIKTQHFIYLVPGCQIALLGAFPGGWCGCSTMGRSRALSAAKTARGVEMVFVISSLSAAAASCLTIPRQKRRGAHQEIALLKARALFIPPLVTCNVDDPRAPKTLKKFYSFFLFCKNCFCGSFYDRN
jgi:hypothetical protein